MKKYYFFFLTLVLFFSSSAQDDTTWKEPSKESQAYHDSRVKITVPPYSLQKVKTLAAKIKRDDNEKEILDPKAYQSLSIREKFTYHMIHPESYNQICDAMPPFQDEQKKIFAQLPDAFDEYGWSERQIKFFKDNKDSVMKFMKESISRTKRVGVNFKNAMVEMNAREMVPFLVSTYTISKKDHDILTVLMLLMKNDKYAAFLNSASYKKLYGDEDASYKSYLNFNTANEQLILKRATEFYNGLKN